MATYNKHYPYTNVRRKKQKYSLLEKVVDFGKLPITSGKWPHPGAATTAWAAGDVLQFLQVRAGQTVLGVQVEILTPSTDSGDTIDIGYGDDTVRWGRVNLSESSGVKSYPVTDSDVALQNFGEPLYFSSADTIDLIINKAVIQGRIRLIVHILEDDR
jgi:hypothetical protein